jgi:hypothetical protein
VKEKVKVNLSLSWPWKHIRGTEVWLHSFLTSVLRSTELLTWDHGRYTPGKQPRYLLEKRWAPAPVWTFLGAEKSLGPTEIRIRNGTTHSLVTKQRKSPHTRKQKTYRHRFEP